MDFERIKVFVGLFQMKRMYEWVYNIQCYSMVENFLAMIIFLQAREM